MAKGAWIGIDGKAKKIKNMYIGIDGKAKKIKNAWIGVDGKAKLFYSSGATISFNSVLSATITGAQYLGAGNQFGAIFKRSGNNGTSGYFYNTSLTRSNITCTRTAQHNTLSANPSYLIVAAGMKYSTTDSDTYYNSVDGFNSSGTKTAASSGTSGKTRYGCGGTLGSYAFIAGGMLGSGYSSAVDTYNTSLTKSTRTALTTAAWRIKSGANNSYIIFAGGDNSSDGITAVNAYNSSMTKTSATLTVAKGEHACAYNSNYVMFGGGVNASGTTVNTVYAFNNSLTQTTATALSNTCYALMGSGCPDVGIFAGGKSSSKSQYSTVNLYDQSLTRTTGTSLSGGRSSAGLANINNKYFIFAGGETGHNGDNYTYDGKVQVYNIS